MDFQEWLQSTYFRARAPVSTGIMSMYQKKSTKWIEYPIFKIGQVEKMEAMPQRFLSLERQVSGY